MKNRCQSCGGWNDPLEWPEAEREDFDPNLCYACARQKKIVDADSKESDDNSITPEEDAAELDALDAEAEGGGADDAEA